MSDQSPYTGDNRREYEDSDSRSGRSSPVPSKPKQFGVTDRELYNIPNRAPSTIQKNHLFMVRTFSEPTQCQICGSFMIGLWRQECLKY